LVAYYGKGADFERHLNKYDVVRLDFADFKHSGETATELLGRINSGIIAELVKTYPEAVDEGTEYVAEALAQINDILGLPFVFVIDEWDMIFREYKDDKAGQSAYVDMLRSLFKAGASKRFIKLAYLTGILPIKRYNSESALNNFEEFTMTRPGRLAEYIGFTEEEVKALCDEYDMDFDEARRWYDGYSFSRIEHIYNPNAVVRAMRSGEYGSYWTDTASYTSLSDLISMNFDGLKDCILELLTGERISVNVTLFENDMTNIKCRDDVLTILIHLGYLAYDKSRKAYIPNEEVKTSFYNAIRDTKWTEVLEALRASDALLEATINGDEKAVAERLDAVHMANTSILNYNNENALACVITLAYYNAINEYTLHREQPAGKGYADIIFRPRKYSEYPPMVVELKMNQSAQSALAQIKERRYVEALSDLFLQDNNAGNAASTDSYAGYATTTDNHAGKILLVGVNYDKETKEHTCTIEEITTQTRA
jgi:hypothetical protein